MVNKKVSTFIEFANTEVQSWKTIVSTQSTQSYLQSGKGERHSTLVRSKVASIVQMFVLETRLLNANL